MDDSGYPYFRKPPIVCSYPQSCSILTRPICSTSPKFQGTSSKGSVGGFSLPWRTMIGAKLSKVLCFVSISSMQMDYRKWTIKPKSPLKKEKQPRTAVLWMSIIGVLKRCQLSNWRNNHPVRWIAPRFEDFLQEIPWKPRQFELMT